MGVFKAIILNYYQSETRENASDSSYNKKKQPKGTAFFNCKI